MMKINVDWFYGMSTLVGLFSVESVFFANNYMVSITNDDNRLEKKR